MSMYPRDSCFPSLALLLELFCPVSPLSSCCLKTAKYYISILSPWSFGAEKRHPSHSYRPGFSVWLVVCTSAGLCRWFLCGVSSVFVRIYTRRRPMESGLVVVLVSNLLRIYRMQVTVRRMDLLPAIALYWLQFSLLSLLSSLFYEVSAQVSIFRLVLFAFPGSLVVYSLGLCLFVLAVVAPNTTAGSVLACRIRSTWPSCRNSHPCVLSFCTSGIVLCSLL